MEEYQGRVIKERYELGTKIVALTTFIYGNPEDFHDIDAEQRWMLKDQLNAMIEYFEILSRRIEYWKAEERADLLANE